MSFYDRGLEVYVSVMECKQNALNEMKQISKNITKINSTVIDGCTVASTFWGKSLCHNLKSYGDFSNQLPLKHAYIQNGSILDLQIQALVMGLSICRDNVLITPMIQDKWGELVKSCSNQINSLVELFQEEFAKVIMSIMTEEQQELFPKPQEIKFNCSYPNWAAMFKYMTDTISGIGVCLNNNSELLFKLCQVEHLDLISKATIAEDNIASVPSISILDDARISKAVVNRALKTKIVKTSRKAKVVNMVKTKTSAKVKPSTKVATASKTKAAATTTSKVVKAVTKAKAAPAKKKAAPAKTVKAATKVKAKTTKAPAKVVKAATKTKAKTTKVGSTKAVKAAPKAKAKTTKAVSTKAKKVVVKKVAPVKAVAAKKPAVAKAKVAPKKAATVAKKPAAVKKPAAKAKK